MSKKRAFVRIWSIPCALFFGLVVIVAQAVRADSGDVPVVTHDIASGDATATAAILWTRIDRDTSVKVEG